MADKVHPADAADAPPATAEENNNPSQPPPAPSYVIQVPKDQIYRYPPPENAHKYDLYVRRANRRRRSCCCCLLVWITSFLAALALAAAIAAAVIYFSFHPKIPRYSVDAVSIKGFGNLTAAGKPFAPEIDVTVAADNPNEKIGIYYRDGSSIRASYSGVDLGGGAWPAFYHRPRNTTVVRTALTGPVIELSHVMRGELLGEERAGAVPLRIDVRVPVRVKVGRATTWTITVKARCAVTVDGMKPGARVVSKTCGVRVKLF